MNQNGSTSGPSPAHQNRNDLWPRYGPVQEWTAQVPSFHAVCHLDESVWDSFAICVRWCLLATLYTYVLYLSCLSCLLSFRNISTSTTPLQKIYLRTCLLLPVFSLTHSSWWRPYVYAGFPLSSSCASLAHPARHLSSRMLWTSSISVPSCPILSLWEQSWPKTVMPLQPHRWPSSESSG